MLNFLKMLGGAGNEIDSFDDIEADVDHSPKSKGNNTFMIILIIVILCIVCCSCSSLLLMLSGKKNQSASNNQATQDSNEIVKCDTCNCNNK